MSSAEARISTIEPPRQSTSVSGWLRRNLFSSWLNTLISLVLLALVGLVLFTVGRWIFTQATWRPVIANLRLLMVGLYPVAQIWRVQTVVGLLAASFGLSAGLRGGLLRYAAMVLAGALVVLAVLPLGLNIQLFWAGMAALLAIGYLLGRRAPALRLVATIIWLVLPWLSLALIAGVPGLLTSVPSLSWGGLLLTLILAVFPIVFSFPIGVLLALGRRSKLPVVRGFCVAYIEIIRGVPLISVLFMGALLLPLFINRTPPQLIRAIVALTLFSAAYLAENVRGGLQAVPRGQEEAAKALGLNIFQTMFLIVLPQALRAVIPAIVGQFISLFKDTSLVAIIALNELLGIANSVIQQREWLGIPGGVQREVLLFVALIYWMFCFSMAQFSRKLEQHLGVGTR
jgi:general L-amino acid transport system permease protein